MLLEIDQIINKERVTIFSKRIQLLMMSCLKDYNLLIGTYILRLNSYNILIQLFGGTNMKSYNFFVGTYSNWKGLMKICDI